MISAQKEEKANKMVNSCIQEEDGAIRKATAREEWVMCVKDLKMPTEKVILDSILHDAILIRTPSSERITNSSSHTNTQVMW